MKLRTIEAKATSTAGVDAVWALIAEVETWSEWGAFDESALERPGHPNPRGAGALRRFRTGRIRNQEEVVHFDPPHVFAYVVRESDVPVRDYRAEVELNATPEGGTTISWRSTFRARWPGTGTLLQRRLNWFITDNAERLASAAQARQNGR